MCPLCLSTAATVAISAASAGGIAALFVKLRASKAVSRIIQNLQKTGGQDELSANRFAS